MLISVISGAIAFAVALAIVIHRPSPEHTTSSSPQNASADLEHREARAAFENVRPLSSNDDPAISTAIEQLKDAVQRQDTAAIADDFDAERLFEELDGLVHFGLTNRYQKAVFVNDIRTGIERAFAAKPEYCNWSSHGLKKIVVSDDGREAVVYDLQFHGVVPNRYTQKVRWWLRRGALKWKVWDVEDMGEGLRMSSAYAALLPRRGAPGASAATIQSIQQITVVAAVFQRHDYARCEIELKKLDGMSLPPSFIAIRFLLWARLHAHQLRFDHVLKDCDAAERAGGDVPIVYQYRAVAYDKLGQYENVLANTTKWEDAMGDDSELHYLMGDALSHLKRTDEAAVAFEKSLDEDPEAAGSLVGLSAVLPAGKKGEVARRFALSQNPATIFAIAAPAMQRTRDLDGMRAMLDAYRARPESTGDSKLAYYEAEWMIVHKRYKEAEAALKPLLPLSNQPGQAQYATEYFFAAVLSHDALGAYAQAPDPVQAFNVMARRLFAGGDYQTLEELVAAHLSKFPRDAWGNYYHAKLLQDVGDFASANAAYSAAMTTGNSADVDTFRVSWVYERFISGRGLSAYDDIKPSDKVFAQLGRLFGSRKDRSDLSTLIAARRADAPDDPNLPLWDADMKFLDRNYAEAVQILVANRDTIEADEFNKQFWLETYVRCQVRLRQYDAARTELSRTGAKDLWRTAIVECAAGNIAEGTKALDALLKQDDGSYIWYIYADPDLGPALSAPGFAAWRQSHPNPKSRPTSQPEILNNGIGA
jgi:tetratricopeptide (TPR) repeat protein